MNQPDSVRLRKIIDMAGKLLDYIRENRITEEDILSSYTVQWTITTPLYNIGEHTYHLSPELKAAHDEVPWSQIAGMRHRLVHQYEDTNWSIISYVVFHELEPYMNQLTDILSTLSSKR